MIHNSLFKDTIRELWLRLADLGVGGYRHRLNPLGFGPLHRAASQQTILDLDHLIFQAPGPLRLVSHPYRCSPIPHYPSIETWAVKDGSSFSQAAAYRCAQFHNIRQRLAAPHRLLDGAYAVFPHLTSHFGHWVGDHLGAILWFASEPRVIANGRCLLVMAPSPAWAELLLQLCPSGSIKLLTPEQWLTANLQLSDALLLPRLSSWQNLALARDRLASLQSADMGVALAPEKLWLTSMRSERISNLESVCKLFRFHGFTVLDPTGLPIDQLLMRLRRASSLWCEHGSMVLNPLLSRTRPYRVLELDPTGYNDYPSELAFLGGGLYNTFHRGLIKPFFCPSTGSRRDIHPYQRQLRVDLNALEIELTLERFIET